jgi:hypothetical protein
MNFELLWIDILLSALLWAMASVATFGRARSKWVRWPLYAIGVAIPLLVLGGMLAVAINIKYANNWLHYVASLVITYTIGTIVILWKASRRNADARPAAATWRRIPLIVGWLIAIVVGYTTLINMDLALRARCALLSTQLNTLYIAMTPAIVSDSQNAATLYEQAFQRLDKNPLEAEVHNPPTGDLDVFDPNEPATLNFLAHESSTIALLRHAAAMPACRFEQDLSVTMNLLELNATRNAANVLALDAKEEIFHHHPEAAIADISAIYGISRHTTRRPLLVSALVGMGVDAIATENLQDLLPIVTRPEELNALHLDTLTPIGQAFHQSLWGEERYGLMCYGSLADDPDPKKKSELENEDLLMSSGTKGSLFRVLFLNLDAYLSLMKHLQDAALKPYYQTRGHLFDADGFNPSTDIMTAIIAPSMKLSLETAARVDAGDASARTAVAMTRYRLEHGSYPQRLDDLVPKYLDVVPTDPFDGHPLRLAIKNNQWIIYSVGPSLIDHGGVESNYRNKGDIIFALKTPGALPTTDP